MILLETAVTVPVTRGDAHGATLLENCGDSTNPGVQKYQMVEGSLSDPCEAPIQSEGRGGRYLTPARHHPSNLKVEGIAI